MTIKCPNCGAAGKVPTGSISATRRIRCPKCGVSFDCQSDNIDLEELPGIVLEQPNQFGGGSAVIGVQQSRAMPQVVTGPITTGSTSATDAPDESRAPLDISIPDSDSDSDDEDDGDIPPEPWFYGFLSAWGVLYLVAAGLSLAVMALAFIGVLINPMLAVSNSPASYLLVGIPFVVVAFVATTCAAAIFLFVDLARNVRRTRFHSERTEALVRNASKFRT